MYKLPMLPIPNLDYTFPWWVAFNQVKELPEQILGGRMKYVLDWIFDHSLIDKQNISDHDREIYLKSYDTAAGIRASNGWYQAFAKDIEDSKTYDEIKMSVLGIGASGYDMLKQALEATTADLKMVVYYLQPPGAHPK